jgi:hypothetical protein
MVERLRAALSGALAEVTLDFTGALAGYTAWEL